MCREIQVNAVGDDERQVIELTESPRRAKLTPASGKCVLTDVLLKRDSVRASNTVARRNPLSSRSGSFVSERTKLFECHQRLSAAL
jgi:hypothetical protein